MGSSSGCGSSCSGSCDGGSSSSSCNCSGCVGCGGACSSGGCGDGCNSSCKGCDGCSGCGGDCSGQCSGCGSGCANTCTGSCTGKCTGSCTGSCDNVCSNTEATNLIANMGIGTIIRGSEIAQIQEYANKELTRRGVGNSTNSNDINKSAYHNKLFSDMHLLGLSTRTINAGDIIKANNYKDAISLLKQKMAEILKV